MVAVGLAASATGAGCAHSDAPLDDAPSTTEAPTDAPTDAHEQNPREQIAAKLMPGVVSYEDARAKLEAGVGGIFLTSWADPGLLTESGRDINALRAEFDRPFEVAIDFEGGRVQRFDDILGSYPSARDMAAGGPEGAQAQGAQIGATLRDHSINVDFAPVLDVDGGDLEVVGDRSFSPDPQQAGELGAAFARGLQSSGVRPVFKHFPGHGRASGDTHQGDAVTPPLDDMQGHDLVPYTRALPESQSDDPATAPGVMVGHMVVPGLGDGETPSSLNPDAYGLLRDQFGFGGTVYTDDLTGMQAITDRFAPADAATAALAAGADVVLWSAEADINEVLDTAEQAARDGRIQV